ncbi:DNA-binding response regulator [Zhengella mangrovi]|uniref:DNA-binding response regulator n=1 Tax=Zhengella mangrovi TaxID=1982044 RepID=A0A2G1QJN5_9HYPH|nr:response regulator transcription factor [Zhengella mangrovi]PHP65670.1 DNA-binding response regulator [Zhengella mangrovi]
MPDAVHVVVADDHPLYRAGVVRTLTEAPDFTVVGEAGSADAAVELVGRQRPAVVLLDISMPGGGIAAAARIADASPDTAIVMLTASEEESDILDALAAGARGYALKGAGAQDLLQILRTVADGGSYVSPSLAGRMLLTMRRDAAKPASQDGLAGLSERERQILDLVSRAMSNKEIGRALDLQEKTVKHYMTGILQKLQVRNRTEAALVATRARDGQ